MSIGKEVAMARKRKGIIQEQLSLEIPVSRESLAKYETEQRRLPKIYENVLLKELMIHSCFLKCGVKQQGMQVSRSSMERI